MLHHNNYMFHFMNLLFLKDNNTWRIIFMMEHHLIMTLQDSNFFYNKVILVVECNKIYISKLYIYIFF
jgi:hypothetical protein